MELTAKFQGEVPVSNNSFGPQIRRQPGNSVLPISSPFRALLLLLYYFTAYEPVCNNLGCIDGTGSVNAGGVQDAPHPVQNGRRCGVFLHIE
jgi:hypothetical protein